MSQNRYLTPLLSVHFVGTLGFSIILPFLVFIVERFQGNSFVYGLLGATYPAFQFIGAPILGKWSDKYGRKRILLLSQLGTLLSWGVFLLGLYMPVEVLVEFDSEWTGTTILTLPIAVLFLARALDGLTGAIYRWPTPICRTFRRRKTKAGTMARCRLQPISDLYWDRYWLVF